MENVEYWDFMGWEEMHEPEVGLQLKWNESLIGKIHEVSMKINRSSYRGGADTITIHPALEGLLHPEHYDNHRKILKGGYNVKFDENNGRYVIKLENLKILENLVVIPEVINEGEVNFKSISDCEEEQVVNYIESLVGFIIVENLFI